MQAIFAYIPVVHAGTLSFLEAHKELPLLLLDNAAAKKENAYLERDIRALDALLVRAELSAHGFHNVTVVAPQELEEATGAYESLLVPEDEILDHFLHTYIPQMQVSRINTFLRWTKQISTAEHEVPEDRIITHEQFANEMLGALAQKAQMSPDWWRQIAAALVKDGEVLAEGYNKHLPTSHALEIHGDPRSNLDAGQGPGIYTSIHAEACALAHAAKKGVATEGADLYVTTFPCPTCARSVVEAGIKRVFYEKGYSLLDAEDILRGAKVEIILVKQA